MTPQKLTRITQAHAQAVYAWALEEHYRQVEKHARRQKKENPNRRGGERWIRREKRSL